MSDIEVIYRVELNYQKSTSCYDSGDGFIELKPFIKCATTFFDLLGASVLNEEFWSYDESQPFAPNIEGYNITIVFDCKPSFVFKFIDATSLFFNIYEAEKMKEKLYLVPKNNDSKP